MTTTAPCHDDAGLTASEAARRLARDGPNELVPAARRARWRAWVRPLTDPLVALLLIAIPVYVAIGDALEAIVVAVALIPVVAMGTVLEARAERTLEELHRLTARTVRARRDGRETILPADRLVVDDIVLIREGDVVPADGRVLDLTELHIDEASLTGESLPVTKAIGDPLYAGTTVLSGRATARVDATGSRTRYGKIGTLLAEVETPRTPLQIAVTRLVVVFAVVASVVCVGGRGDGTRSGSPGGDAVIAGIASRSRRCPKSSRWCTRSISHSVLAASLVTAPLCGDSRASRRWVRRVSSAPTRRERSPTDLSRSRACTATTSMRCSRPPCSRANRNPSTRSTSRCSRSRGSAGSTSTACMPARWLSTIRSILPGST